MGRIIFFLVLIIVMAVAWAISRAGRAVVPLAEKYATNVLPIVIPFLKAAGLNLAPPCRYKLARSTATISSRVSTW